LVSASGRALTSNVFGQPNCNSFGPRDQEQFQRCDLQPTPKNPSDDDGRGLDSAALDQVDKGTADT